MQHTSLKVTPLAGLPHDIEFIPRRIYNAAYAGRSAADVNAHINEMGELGVKPPDQIPLISPISNHLLSTANELQTYANTTSGEVEYVLFWHRSEILVGVGSDHCDLWLERHCHLRSKNVMPNIVAPEVWMYSDVVSHFDDLELFCEELLDGEWCLTQHALCNTLLAPDYWIDVVKRNFPVPDGTVLYSGTIGRTQNIKRGATGYRIRLHNPHSGLSLEHSYNCHQAELLKL